MYVSRIFGHVSRHEIHKALQFKDPLPRTPVKMYLLVSKSGWRFVGFCLVLGPVPAHGGLGKRLLTPFVLPFLPPPDLTCAVLLA